MRIALIAPPWVAIPPLAYGGTEAVVDGLARALDATGHEVLLFATGDSACRVPRSWSYDTALGVAAARPASELHHVVNAYDWIAGEADVVHARGRGHPHGGSGRDRGARRHRVRAGRPRRSRSRRPGRG